MVGETLKALKNQLGWSNQKLADAANLPVDTVNKILSGSTKNPNPDTLKRLAAAFDLTVDDLQSMGSVPAEPDRAPRKTSGDLPEFYERQLAQTVASYEKRLEEANEREKLQHLRHERQFFAMLLLIAALIALIIYLIIDALHGNWGIFQYADIMTRVSPSSAGKIIEHTFL